MFSNQPSLAVTAALTDHVRVIAAEPRISKLLHCFLLPHKGLSMDDQRSSRFPVHHHHYSLHQGSIL